MTLYQAKGLEFPVVIVPNLLEGEWPVREHGLRLVPARAPARAGAGGRPPHGRGAPPPVRGDDPGPGAAVALHPRRALAAKKAAVRFVAELLEDARGGADGRDRSDGRREPTRRPMPSDAADGLRRRRATRARPMARAHQRRAGRRPPCHAPAHRARAPPRPAPAGRGAGGSDGGCRGHGPGGHRGPRGLRRRASWTLGRAPRCPPTRRGLPASTRSPSGRSRWTPVPAPTSSPSRPCPVRVLVLRARRLRAVPAQVRAVVRLPHAGPGPARRRAFAFGNTAHEAFEAFTRERRERIARGEPPPTREEPGAPVPGRLEAGRLRRHGHRGRLRAPSRIGLLDNFWTGELCAPGRGPPRGAGLRAGPGPRRRHRPRSRLRRHRPHRPAALAAASRSSTTRPATPRARRTWTRTCSSPSTRWPAGTRWAWARPSA